MEKKLLCVIILLFAAITLSPVAIAAGPPLTVLRGDFAFIGTRTCVQNASPDNHFVGPKLALQNFNSPAGYAGTTRSTHYQGVLHFNGDGTGVLSDKALQINATMMQPGNTPLNGWTEVCDVVIQTLEDGTNVLNFPEECVVTFTSGAGLGTIQGSRYISPLSVFVSANGDTLLLSDVEPDEEESWQCQQTPEGPNCETIFTNYRICTRTFTATRLAPVR